MQTNAVQKEIKTFHAFSLVETLEELQKAILDGYRLDLDSNENYPQLYGTHYIISVVKDVPVAVSKEDTPAEKEPEAQAAPKAALKLKGRN